MKRFQAEHPYSDYWLYKIWHKNEGRWQANLVLISDTKIRTTISYARYLMSVKLSRILDKTEHVDHVDNNKDNDLIENLQILSQEENIRKQQMHYRENNFKYVTLNCTNCGKEFEYLSRNYKFHKKNGRENFNCSKKCANESLKKQ